jgi:effector-binding domain-containing protein
MFNKVVYVVVITILLFIFVGLFLPSTVHVERSAEIARPASTVFVLLNGYGHFRDWSPWADRDPNAIFELSGPDYGVGARISWQGDPRLVGTGWQEIVDSQPWSLVRMTMDIDRQGRADSYFHLVSTENGTRVTWGFDADLVTGHGFFGGLLARYFGLFFERWIGQDQEIGLARLEAYAESLPASDFAGLEVERVEAQPLDILYVSLEGDPATGSMAADLADAYREISVFMAEHSVPMLAQPMAITRRLERGEIRFDAAVPFTAGEVAPSGNVQIGKSPGGPAVRLIHRGPYDRMIASYEKLAAYMAAHDLKEGRVSWEHYLSDPAETAPKERITWIYYLIDNEGEAQAEQ